MSEYEENLIVDMHESPAYWAEKYLELEAQLAEAREEIKKLRKRIDRMRRQRLMATRT